MPSRRAYAVTAAILGGPKIEVIVLLAVVGWIAVFGMSAARAALRMNRNSQLWFAFGAILGPVALVLLQAAPPGMCRSCGTPTRGWLTECWWCRADVRGNTSPPPRVWPRSTPSIADRPAWSAREHHVQAVPSNGFRADEPQHLPQKDRFAGKGVPISPPNAEPASSLTSLDRPTPSTSVQQPRRTGTATSLDRPTPSTSVQQPRRTGTASVWVPPATVDQRTTSDRPTPARSPGVLGTAVYITGSANLVAGLRYGIAIKEGRLQILGPAEIDPQRVALDRPLASLEARVVEGRLILGNREGLVLAFMAGGGISPQVLADAIAAGTAGSGHVAR